LRTKIEYPLGYFLMKVVKKIVGCINQNCIPWM
jgi:hypothetical protein